MRRILSHCRVRFWRWSRDSSGPQSHYNTGRVWHGITALTAQNTTGVQAIHEVPASFVAKQIDSVLSDIGVDAIKTGMLANSDIIEVVAQKIKHYRIKTVVVDPVMVAKSGDLLLRKEAREALTSKLFPSPRWSRRI